MFNVQFLQLFIPFPDLDLNSAAQAICDCCEQSTVHMNMHMHTHAYVLVVGICKNISSK